MTRLHLQTKLDSVGRIEGLHFGIHRLATLIALGEKIEDVDHQLNPRVLVAGGTPP